MPSIRLYNSRLVWTGHEKASPFLWAGFLYISDLLAHIQRNAQRLSLSINSSVITDMQEKNRLNPTRRSQ